MRKGSHAVNTFLWIVMFAGIAVFVWALSHRGNGQPWPGRLALVSGMATLGIGCLFRLGIPKRTNAAIAILSTIVAVYLANAALEIATWKRPVERYDQIVAQLADAAGPRWDGRDKLTFLQSLRASGVNAYPSAPVLYPPSPQFPDNFTDFIPVTNIANVASVFCNESGEYSVYDSDRYGLNNDDRVYDADGPRVILIGDSFAHGACVSAGEDTASNLRQLGIDAVNLGLWGNGPYLELASLIEYGVKLSPSTVFWLYFDGNDLHEASYEHQIPLLRRYLERGFEQNLIDRQLEVDEYWKRLIADREREAIKARPRTVITELKSLLLVSRIRRMVGLGQVWSGSPPTTTEPLPLMRQILSRAAQAASDAGGELFFVYIADGYNYIDGAPPERAGVLEMIKELDIPLIDFSDVLESTGDPLNFFPFRIPAHYSAEGYRLLADTLARAVRP